MSWSKERKAAQKVACQVSAEARRCRKCGKGAAMKASPSGLVCRYCGSGTAKATERMAETAAEAAA